MVLQGARRPCAEVPSAWRRLLCPPGTRWRCVRGARPRRPTTMKAGGGVMDKPTVAKPGVDWRARSLKKRPPVYRVILHNDNFNRREYVVQVLMKVVDGLTLDDAVNAMQEAHLNGLALVTCCAQELAETYCQGLRNNGLTVTMEPDNGPWAPSS